MIVYKPNEATTEAARNLMKSIISGNKDPQELQTMIKTVIAAAYKQGHKEGFINCIKKLKAKMEAAHNEQGKPDTL